MGHLPMKELKLFRSHGSDTESSWSSCLTIHISAAIGKNPSIVGTYSYHSMIFHFKTLYPRVRPRGGDLV